MATAVHFVLCKVSVQAISLQAITICMRVDLCKDHILYQDEQVKVVSPQIKAMSYGSEPASKVVDQNFHVLCSAFEPARALIK